MKNTRRFLAAVMALVMAAGTAMYASAEDTNILNKTTESADTNVNYSVDPSYTVVIPADVTLLDTEDVTKNISLDDNAPFKLAKGAKLSVKIADVDSNDFTVKNGDESVNYTVKVNGNALAKGNTAAEFSEGNTGAKTLTFPKMDNKAKYAGEYTGTLTFTIAVEAAVTPYTPQTYNSLTVGTILHVGDALDLTEHLYLEHGILNSNYIWTLVRGNISSYGEGPEAEVTFTESDNGDYYVFKGVYRTDTTTGYAKYDAIPMTATSDGITVTALNGANVSFAVHES